jgi:hypothetical protein
LLKNGHLLRYPAASPPRRRGKKSLLIRRDPTPHPSGAPAERDFAKLNLHLPACRSLSAGRALFEQPGKGDFFNRLLVLLHIKINGARFKLLFIQQKTLHRHEAYLWLYRRDYKVFFVVDQWDKKNYYRRCFFLGK